MLKLFAYAQALALDAADKLRREEGQTMAEYGVILAVITVAVIAALTFMSGKIGSTISRVGSAIN